MMMMVCTKACTTSADCPAPPHLRDVYPERVLQVTLSQGAGAAQQPGSGTGDRRRPCLLAGRWGYLHLGLHSLGEHTGGGVGCLRAT